MTLTSGKRLARRLSGRLRPRRYPGCWGNWLRPKKGQLAITDRYGPVTHHQLVELGLRRQRPRRRHFSVAFNAAAPPPDSC